ncbi:MAG TPA: hypothetical protein VHZ27_16305 [Solirubrobacteraceae bacterium]|nr:hypothetical protein [Solirubrobacteraceae bacterium]
MPPNNAETPHLRFPRRSAPDPETAQRRLALLTNWQTGAVATMIVVAALLPFAIAWHASSLIAIAASIILAASLAIGTHVVRRRRLATIALSPKLVQLPDVESERKRLQSARTRRALAAGLRRTADPNQPSRRLDPCPVLVGRVAAVRARLLELANDLEQTQTPDPACVAVLRELLTNGSSPLYNPNVPADDLHTALAGVRAALTTQPTS